MLVNLVHPFTQLALPFMAWSKNHLIFLSQMVPGGGAVPTMQRIPLPGAEMLEEEPLYVNAKQYHRILKRRQARAKLEAEGKIPKERRVKQKFTLYLLVFSCQCSCMWFLTYWPVFFCRNTYTSPATAMPCNVREETEGVSIRQRKRRKLCFWHR